MTTAIDNPAATTDTSDGPVCEFQHEAWGPHAGCAEFMSEPDTWPCGDPAAVRFAFRDLRYEHETGEDGRAELVLCGEHAPQARTELAEDVASREIEDLTETDLTETKER